MNISKKITAAALAGALTIGGASAVLAADGTGSGTGGGAGSLASNPTLVAKLCEHKDEIVPKLTAAETKINARITALTDRKAKATAANHPVVVARVDKRLTRMNKLLSRVEKRIDQAPAWIAEHCS